MMTLTFIPKFTVFPRLKRLAVWDSVASDRQKSCSSCWQKNKTTLAVWFSNFRNESLSIHQYLRCRKTWHAGRLTVTRKQWSDFKLFPLRVVCPTLTLSSNKRYVPRPGGFQPTQALFWSWTPAQTFPVTVLPHLTIVPWLLPPSVQKLQPTHFWGKIDRTLQV